MWKDDGGEYDYGWADDSDEIAESQKPTVVLMGLKRSFFKIFSYIIVYLSLCCSYIQLSVNYDLCIGQ